MKKDEEITVVEAVKPDYESEIIKIIKGNYSPRAAQNKLEGYHGNDVAGAMDALSVSERKKLYRICTAEMLAETFEHLDEDEAGAYLDEMDIQKAAAVVSNLEADTATYILREIERQKRVLIIDALPMDIRKDIALVASFDEDEIGSRMTTNCIVIRENLTIKQAMDELVSQAEGNDNISTIFVTDSDGEFYGAIDLKELIIARHGTDLDNLVQTSFPYVYGHEAIDDCIEKLKDYSEDSVPVLDDSNRFLGVITSQSLVEVIDDEMGEDYARLAGLIAEEDIKEPLSQSMKKRLPWLLALFALGILVSTVVGAFEQVVAQLTLIMAFQSIWQVT